MLSVLLQKSSFLYLFALFFHHFSHSTIVGSPYLYKGVYPVSWQFHAESIGAASRGENPFCQVSLDKSPSRLIYSQFSRILCKKQLGYGCSRHKPQRKKTPNSVRCTFLLPVRLYACSGKAYLGNNPTPKVFRAFQYCALNPSWPSQIDLENSALKIRTVQRQNLKLIHKNCSRDFVKRHTDFAGFFITNKESVFGLYSVQNLCGGRIEVNRISSEN